MSVIQVAESDSAPDLARGELVARLRERLDRFEQLVSATGDLCSVGEKLVEIAPPLRARLVGLPLPLPRERYEEARTLVDAQIVAAKLYLRILQEMRSPFLLGFSSEESVAVGGLRLLADAFETCCLAGASVPAGFWITAHGLYLHARGEGFSAHASAYKHLLALSTLQPESFTSIELVDVFAMVRAFAELGELVGGGSEVVGQGWFWVDFAQDAAPVAVVRREPPPVDDLAYFSAAALARAASDRLAKRTEAAQGEIAAEEPDVAGESLLRRLRERWAMPPRRAQPRRRSEYTVQVCPGLDAIWERLKRGEHHSPPPMEWMVLNESPGGFAIMRVAGVAAHLSAGMAIALRRADSASWAVCVVRWIRSEQPDQVELGLQLVSQAAIPVRVAFRSGSPGKAPVCALVLPPLAGVRRHQAVLAPSGTYTARRFLLVHDSERVYVAQGRLLSLDMQTENVELFQFEVDPYPI